MFFKGGLSFDIQCGDTLYLDYLWHFMVTAKKLLRETQYDS